MIAPRRTSASPRSTSLIWLACGLAAVVACSNQITYSRLSATLPDSGMPHGAGGSGAGDTSGAGDAGDTGDDGPGAGGTDAGSDAPVGSGGVIGTGGEGGGDAGTGGAGMGGSGMGGSGMGGSGMGGSGMGGSGMGGSGMGGMGTGGAIVDNAQFNFEASAQGWAAMGPWTGPARMTTQHFAGGASFGATLTYTPPATGVAQEFWITPAAGTGPIARNVVTFHVFLPANAAGVVEWVQPYVQDGSTSQLFISAFTPAAMLTFGGWTTITLPLPATTVAPIFKMAVQILASGTVPFTGNIYVDSIGWQ
jgi:hypothetical protein